MKQAQSLPHGTPWLMKETDEVGSDKRSDGCSGPGHFGDIEAGVPSSHWVCINTGTKGMSRN